MSSITGTWSEAPSAGDGRRRSVSVCTRGERKERRTDFEPDLTSLDFREQAFGELKTARDIRMRSHRCGRETYDERVQAPSDPLRATLEFVAEVGVVSDCIGVEIAPDVEQLLVTRFRRRVQLSVEGRDLLLCAASTFVVVGRPVTDVCEESASVRERREGERTGLGWDHVDIAAPDDGLLLIELAEVNFKRSVPRLLLVHGLQATSAPMRAREPTSDAP